jgi:hypothetical protein
MQQSFLSWFATIFAAVAPLASAIQTIDSSLVARSATVNIVHTFEFPSWAENLAVQANGRLLISRLDNPEVIQIDPTGTYPPITVAIWNSTEYKGCLGISETYPGVFYVITAAFFNSDFVKTSGVNSVWKIDMNTFSATTAGVIQSNATVTKLTDIHSADFLNGMTTLDDTHILVGDVYNGWVYKVNTITGAHDIAVNDPLMKFPANATTNLGVNGLKIRGPFLYFTNTAVGSLNQIEITSTGHPVGSSRVISANVPRADDFIFKDDGTAFIAQNQMDELSVLPAGSSEATVIAGSDISTVLAGVTAGKFGRLESDANRLYLTTSGGECVLEYSYSLPWCAVRKIELEPDEMMLMMLINRSCSPY